MMFTNTDIITVFHKNIDPVQRLEVWEKHTFHNVYWENCSAQDNSKISKSMTEDNLIFCIIPENSIGDFIPRKDDKIIKGDFENLSGLKSDQCFTVMSVKDFRYGSSRVHHIEVNAK